MSERPVADDLRGRVPLVAASYAVITRGAGEATEALLQLRRGTSFMDGWWACGAAGHVEDAASASSALAQEVREELGVEVVAASPLTTVHRGCLVGRIEQRADFFFHVTELSGEPSIAEPDKAADLRWWPLAGLPERVVPHERAVLEALATELGGGQRVPAVIEHGFAQSLTLVAAIGANRAIGADGGMPWHLPEDLRHFKEVTMGGVMVMGRRTWDSIGRALPGRRTIVVTSDLSWSAQGAEVAHSLPEALLVAGDREVFVVGGGEIYRQTIAVASRLEITHVDVAPEAEVFFPEIDPAVWVESARSPGAGLAFVTYGRR
ncbi:dihydrofolate reductase [Janibacter sp. YIM B02568]|uniref:dihydrofolate reductase n=1 Tax=Janibacter endophyticus TaxID=2806261 RepID=UPI00194EA6EE|nr:dihydrofolate reductase [Janibacter endophyticus]MBM6546742.1 dihydrofolate reductase [Janibacter endophyticus]